MFELPTWRYNRALASVVEEERLPLPQSQLLAIAYLRSIDYRVHELKKSWLASFEGGHREGKSVAACTMACMLDKTFEAELEDRIIHGHEHFMRKIKEFDTKKIYGGVVIADEAGTVGNFSSAEWQTQWMAAITSVFQMFGYLHPVILFIAPDRSFIESKTRKMFHAHFRVSRPNNKYSVVKPFSLRWNQMKHKWTEVHPVIRIGNNRIKMRDFHLSLPPKEILERYQSLEQTRKPIMLENLDQRIKASHIIDAKRSFDNNALADAVFKDISKYETKRSKSDNRIIDPVLIKVGMGVPMDNAKYIKTLVERRFEEMKPKVQP
jgi:hypothetical protein